MTINTLHNNLIEAYSLKNLNRISLILIQLFKEKQFHALKKIAEIVFDNPGPVFSSDGKEFSSLMMLYHPDRREIHLKILNELFEKNDFDGLLDYSHVLRLEKMEEIAIGLSDGDDIDFSPVYEWDFESSGFSIYDDEGKKVKNSKKPTFNTKESSYNFYDAIKMRMYGTLDIEFPSYYLEDIDELELSDSCVTDLDGVEFCIHTVSMDLSSNKINDISNLWDMTQLQNINLSYNQIGYIDSLSNMQNLQHLDISYNLIDDISPLFSLQKLESVYLAGNQIPQEQIEELKELGVIVRDQ